LDLIDSIASLLLLEIGSAVFLSIEFYQEVISTGQLETVIDKQGDLISKLRRKTLVLENILKKNQISYKRDDIDDLFNESKSLTPGLKEIRILVLKNFLSDRFFGSNLTVLLNSLVIVLPPLWDPITAMVTSIVPLLAWILNIPLNNHYKKELERQEIREGIQHIEVKQQFISNILSYSAISSVVGQVAYFATVFAIPPRDMIIWTFDGLIPFFTGFLVSMIVLLVPLLFKTKFGNRDDQN
jgi:hypothetical protein